MNLENETMIKNSIERNNKLKEKIIHKLDTITNIASSLIDINKNIYSQNKNLALSPNNIIENILKEYIIYNESLLSNENKESISTNENIMKLYKEITGISISRTNELNLKIRFDFLCGKNEYYIILSYDNSNKNKNANYNVITIHPEAINYKNYVEELNKTQDINLFISKLINYELIPFYEKENLS